MLNDAPSAQSSEKSQPTQSIYQGQVVAVDDPKGLGRVKVEIPGLTQGIDKDILPWFSIMQPVGLGGSLYSGNFSVPQENTLVMVMFPNKDMYSGIVIGVVINRVTLPDDKLNLCVDYIHPKASEHHFTQNWDKVDDTVKGQKHFSCDFSDDYPRCWGWVSNAMTWVKENMVKRTFEFVHNSFTKFKIYYNGDTILHITGNLKLIIEKDFYLEVRGSEDHITMNQRYDHVIGNHVHMVEHLYSIQAKRGFTLQGKAIGLQ